MADKKITQLTNITGADLVDADEFVVVDISADETKAITLAELKTAFDSGTGFVRVTGDTMTGDLALSGADVTFGDNDKAIFGAGSGLQIYYNSSNGNSYIHEAGSGDLLLQGVDVKLRSSDDGANMLHAVENGAVSIYYNGAPKLATTATGIDVTGTILADAYALDSIALPSAGTATIFNRNTDNNLYIQTDSGNTVYLLDGSQNSMYAAAPTSHIFLISNSEKMRIDSTGIDVTGTILADGLTVDKQGSGGASGSININGTGESSILLYNSSGAADQRKMDIRYTAAVGYEGLYFRAINDANNDYDNIARFDPVRGDISFYEDTGTTAKFFWDASAENLNIGAVSSQTSYKLHVTGTAGSDSGDVTTRIEAGTVSSNSAVNHATLDLTARAKTSGGTALAQNTEIRSLGNASGNGGTLAFYTDNSSAAITQRMVIDSSGNVGIGVAPTTSYGKTLQIHNPAATGSNLRLTNSGSGSGVNNGFEIIQIGANNYLVNRESGFMAFSTSSEEAMRIDSSGRVGIGGVPNTNWRNDIANQEVLMLGTETTLYSDAGVTTQLLNNVFLNNSDTYLNISTRGASQYFQYQGTHKWFTAASASAGSSINTEMTTPKMTLDVSGKLLFNTTVSTDPATNNATNAIRLANDTGRISASADGTQALNLNRKSSDGEIIVFRKNGAPVGSIGAANSTTMYVSSSSGGGLRFTYTGSDPVIAPCNTTGVDVDGSADLGYSAGRFKDLYLSGGVYLGGTGAANKLDDYEYGFFEPTFTGETTNPSGVTYDPTVGNEGYYVKVGRAVFIQINIRTDGISNVGVGNLRISGLPFATASVSGQGGVGSFAVGQVADFAGQAPDAAYMSDGTTNIQLFYRSSFNGSSSPSQCSDLGTGTNDNLIRLSGTYYSTA